MTLTTALYLAHLNPVTLAHVQIIRELLDEAGRVKVMPVVFYDGNKEVNSRSFPFTFGQRKEMIESEVDGAEVSADYAFYSPFRRYLPPLISPRSWALKKGILRGVDDYYSYTGDRSEWLALKAYGLRPRIGARKKISATSAREQMYRAALGLESDWKSLVPGGTARVAEREWDAVKRFAREPDSTARVLGMKFPRRGY